MLLRNPGPGVAVEVGERIRAAVRGLDLRPYGVPPVSVSIGVAVANDPHEDVGVVDRDRRPGPVQREAPRPRPGGRRVAAPTADPRTIAAMPRRVARTDPPPDARPEVELDAEEPPTDPSDPDLAPADADLRDDEERAERDLTNGDLARIFHEIGDMLEVKGELSFKTVAYHRAADAIGRSPVDLVAAYRDGEVPKIPGVGPAISDKIKEIATTGRMAYYDKLIAEVPPSLVELLRIPGLGPKTVRQIWLELGILSIDDLRTAAEAGTIRGLRGLSERTEQLILEGIRRLESTPAPHAPAPRGGDDPRHHRGPHGHARRHIHRAGRVVPPPPRLDRRPRPPGRDRRWPAVSSSDSRRSVWSTRCSTRAATRPR